jgi:hypothetical protein
MSGLDDLTLNRRNIKNAIRRLQNSISDAEIDVNVLETSLESISDLFKEYDAVQFKIEKLQLKKKDADEAQLAEESDKERGEVETQYRAIVSKIKSLLRKNKSSASDSINIKAPVLHGQESLDCINLKPLPLPIFTGKYGEWFTFYESFKCLVANNASISEIRKFHYLRGCLKDEALRAIESLSISGDNYVNAIELLRKRFENKRLIVQEHVSNILSMSPILKSSHIELRALIDTINNNIAALEVLDIKTDS